MKNISSLLVANRGEIAVRIIRACHHVGVKAILATSTIDRESLAAQWADRVVCIGPAPAGQGYLNIGGLIMAAVGTGAEAIHPGYGFLAEQPDLPEACARYGIRFVGPKAEQIRQMGDKILARRMAANLEIPVIPGSELARDLSQALATADTIGYPVLLKAAAGGGGRGMKIVPSHEDMKILFDEASEEARAAFGDPRLYMERLIPHARHIEIQILGDRFDHIVHLGERDCSLQRRHQKLLEEAPSPVLSMDLRAEIAQSALALVRQIQYESAGTVEFILDPDQNKFYFLEMNTRIQVEHPVTEMISGVNLVEEQIRIADEESLGFSQEDIQLSGHSMECRINAESPAHGFRPCPGQITQWEVPKGPGIRIDTHCYPGYVVPPHYDSLLAKLITWGQDRREAIQRMQDALIHFRVAGVDTTIPLHRWILQHPQFQEGTIHTRLIEETLPKEFEQYERNQLC